MADEAEFDGFVLGRSPALLRTAYLLVQDEGLAEDLLQTALTKAWFAWTRIEDPEAYVRRIMVTTSASWWRQRWRRETPTDEPPEPAKASEQDAPTDAHDLWVAIGHLPRRQRAVVVLRFLEDRTQADTAYLMAALWARSKASALRPWPSCARTGLWPPRWRRGVDHERRRPEGSR